MAGLKSKKKMDELERQRRAISTRQTRQVPPRKLSEKEREVTEQLQKKTSENSNEPTLVSFIYIERTSDGRSPQGTEQTFGEERGERGVTFTALWKKGIKKSRDKLFCRTIDYLRKSVVGHG